MTRRRVAFLTVSYPTAEQPAAGIFVREHARAAARFCDVAVVHLDRGGGPYALAPVEDEPFPTLRVTYPRSARGFADHFRGTLAALRRLRREGFDPDVVHAHFFLAALPPLALRPLVRRPVVLTEHWSAFLPEDPLRLSRLLRTSARFAFRRAERVLPVSEALHAAIVAEGFRGRFEVVPNTVDDELFQPGAAAAPDERRRLLSVALLYDAKGVDILLNAIAVLSSRRADFRLDIVGDGPRRGDYEALVTSLGLGDVVSFRGLASKTRVAAYMQAADLFVLASRYDNNPCALIEALATGLPAVGTRVGGIPEILEHGSGLLARPDAADIAARIEEALDRPAQFDRARIAARAKERYGMDAIGRRLAAVYEEAISEHAGTRGNPLR